MRNHHLPSVMKHKFSEVPSVSIQRSKFKRSHGYKTTFDAGYLIPVFCDEVLPGDTFELHSSFFGRVATPITPIMDNMFLDVQFFFVPNRLVWNNWQKFNGEQDDPDDPIDFLVPEVSSGIAGTFANGSLFDYFGVPTQVLNTTINALPIRAYNLIYNTWYRDQNLIDSAVVDKDDGPDDPADYVLRRRCKRHDYFTSCLPFAQKGDPVTLPLGISAPVELDLSAAGTSQLVKLSSDYSTLATNGTISSLSGNLSDFSTAGAVIDPNGSMIADLTDATAATINDIRQAFQVQRMLEKDARGGTRYTEILRSHFGVVSPDARLQRPEFLGQHTTRISMSPIPQTSETTEASPLGTLSAYGTFSKDGKSFSHSFVEHGYIIGLASVRADLTYQNGLERMWSRSTRYDFYWPTLAHLGEQAVLNKEIAYNGNSSDDEVFGYQERYAEYRYKPSKITGQFRSNFAQTLDIWHLSQDFTFSPPSLNQTFIEENPPIDRIKALDAEYPDFLLDCYFDLDCTRPMPVYGVPGLIDHF